MEEQVHSAISIDTIWIIDHPAQASRYEGEVLSGLANVNNALFEFVTFLGDQDLMGAGTLQHDF